MDTSKFRIGKTYISNTNREDAIGRIVDTIESGKGGFICVSNMRMVDYANKTPEYNKLMIKSLMNWPDGRPLYWCGKVWGLKEVQGTSGPNTFIHLLNNPHPLFKNYLLGDTQDVLDEISRKYPNANIAGADSLPFADVKDFDYKGIAERVKASGANVVWTAMTAPKQDEFNNILADYLPNVVLIGVGRAFRISIGQVEDAPKWAAKFGVRGLFIGRKSKPLLIWWYIKQAFVLLSYIFSILSRRIIGKKYYE